MYWLDTKDTTAMGYLVFAILVASTLGFGWCVYIRFNTAAVLPLSTLLFTLFVLCLVCMLWTPSKISYAFKVKDKK